METQEPVVFHWQRKVARRASFLSDLMHSILMAALIGSAITLLVWVTLA